MRSDAWAEDYSTAAPQSTSDWEALRSWIVDFSGYVRHVSLKPGAWIYCTFSGYAYVILSRMRTISERTKAAKGMTFPERSGDRLVSPFISHDGLSCRAFIVLGPEVVNFRHWEARAYHIEGELCAPAETAMSDADLNTYIGSIKLGSG